jgi:hypothetical protein
MPMAVTESELLVSRSQQRLMREGNLAGFVAAIDEWCRFRHLGQSSLRTVFLLLRQGYRAKWRATFTKRRWKIVHIILNCAAAATARAAMAQR